SVCACSVGIAIASSKHESAIDCTPPSAAASAWMAERTMLFSGCWSGGVERRARCAHAVVRGLLERERRAGGLGVGAQHHRARVARAETVAHGGGPQAPEGAVLRDLLEEVHVGVEDP